MPNWFGNVINRSSTAANFNVETVKGTVKKTYTDANGNVTGADVLVAGQATSLVQIPNSSGVRLWAGASVTVNFNKGSRFGASIIGMAGAESGAVLSANAAAASTATYGTTTGTSDISQEQFIIAGNDDILPNAYKLTAGTNTSILYVPGSTDSSGGVINGTATISVCIGVAVGTLPDPTLLAGVLALGTLYELVDSYGGSLGLYRLKSYALGGWHLIAAGSGNGASGGGAALIPAVAVFDTNGSTSAFTLPFTPVGDVACFQQPDGLKIPQSSITSVTGNVVTLNYAPVSGTKTLEILYSHA